MADLKTMIVHASERGSLCLGDGNALQCRSAVYMPRWRDETGSYNMQYVSGKPNADTKSEPVFPYSGPNKIDRTVNMIGKTLYVDFDRGESGSGLSWEDAKSSLNDLLNDPFVYYTCAIQRQVVHARVRGGVSSEAVRARKGYDMQGYLVVHDAEFEFKYPESVPITDGGLPYFIFAPGVVFADCSFTLRMPDGENASGLNDDKSGKNGGHSAWNIPDIGGGDGYGNYDEVELCGDRIYFFRCAIYLYGGNGGDGADGSSYIAESGYPTSDFVVGTNGGNGGCPGGACLGTNGAVILDSCSIEIVAGSCGNGGNGGNGWKGGQGGNSGDMSLGPQCRISALKIYDCDITAIWRPSFHAGDGGSGEEWFYPLYQSQQEGNGGNGGDVVLLKDPIDIRCSFIRGSNISKTIDMSGVSAGKGGPHAPFTYTADGQTVTRYTGGGQAGSIKWENSLSLIYCGEMINTEVQMSVPHLGTSRDVMIPDVTLLYGNRPHLHNVKAVLDFPMAAVYLEDARADAGSLRLNNIRPYPNRAQADTVDIELHIGTPPSPPDGIVIQSVENPKPNTIPELYSAGGDIRGSYGCWLSTPDISFPSKFGQNAEYGIRITSSKPGQIKGGYPGGGWIGNWFPPGWLVDGADGNDSKPDGGTANGAFTWWNWSASDGTPGKGAPANQYHPAGEDGRVSTAYDIDYPSGGYVSVVFV